MASATVATWAEFLTAISQSKDDIYLNANSFTVTSSSVIYLPNKTINVYVADGITGDVVIDSGGAYYVRLGPASTGTGYALHFHGTTAKRIILTGGLGWNVRCQTGDNATVEYVFENCVSKVVGFATYGTGFCLADPDSGNGVSRATLTNCDAYNNTGDGFAIESGSGSGTYTMTCINCNSYWNNNVDDGGGTDTSGRGDGFTSHKPTHRLILYGCKAYQNGATGAAPFGAGIFIAEDCEFYDNCKVDSGALADLPIGGAGTDYGPLFAYVINCRFHSYAHRANQNSHLYVRSDTGPVVVRSCSFLSPTTVTAGDNAIYLNAPSQNKQLIVDDCVFADFINGTNAIYAILVKSDQTLNALLATRNTISNCRNGISIPGQRFCIAENIFVNCTGTAITVPAGSYNNRPGQGNNHFYGNGADISGDSLCATDVTGVDPQLDSNLKRILGSPCAASGRTDVFGDKRSKGAGVYTQLLVAMADIETAVESADVNVTSIGGSADAANILTKAAAFVAGKKVTYDKTTGEATVYDEDGETELFRFALGEAAGIETRERTDA